MPSLGIHPMLTKQAVKPISSSGKCDRYNDHKIGKMLTLKKDVEQSN